MSRDLPPTSAHRAEAQRRHLARLTRATRYERERSGDDPALVVLAVILSRVAAVSLRDIASWTGLEPEVVAEALRVLVSDGLLAPYGIAEGKADPVLTPYLLSEHFGLPPAYVLPWETRPTPAPPGGGIASLSEYDDEGTGGDE